MEGGNTNYTIQCLLIFSGGQVAHPSSTVVESCPQLYRAMAYNSLAFFLLANLATGIQSVSL